MGTIFSLFNMIDELKLEIDLENPPQEEKLSTKTTKQFVNINIEDLENPHGYLLF